MFSSINFLSTIDLVSVVFNILSSHTQDLLKLNNILSITRFLCSQLSKNQIPVIKYLNTHHTAQKMKFSVKDFFSKLRIWSHLLKKILNGKLHFFVQCQSTRFITSTVTGARIPHVTFFTRPPINHFFAFISTFVMVPLLFCITYTFI